MNEYIFRISTVVGGTAYHIIDADNVRQARKKFAEKTKNWFKGWCLLGVYRLIY